MEAAGQAVFKAERISQSASFLIDAPIQKCFPLFGPIREKEWAEGWNPGVIFSNNPLVEKHMIFQTKGSAEEEVYNWAVTEFNPDSHEIEYTVSTANRIWFIKVNCEDNKSSTRVSVTYTFTGLNARGNELNRAALKKMFTNNLKDWQEAINYYLQQGKMLSAK